MKRNQVEVLRMVANNIQVKLLLKRHVSDMYSKTIEPGYY